MAGNTRHKKMVGEREQRIKDLKEIIKGHEQLQQLNFAYIAVLLKKLGAVNLETGIKLTREEIAAALTDSRVLAQQDTDGEWLLYNGNEGEHGEERRSPTEQG